jgi:adenosylhomocysteine nucleosidase
MLLRWLVNNYLRDAAEQAIRHQLREGFSPPSRATPTSDSSPQAAENSENLGCDVALIFALGMECGPLVDQLADAASTKRPHLIEHAGSLGGKLAVIAEGGVGQAAAARTTREIIRAYEPRWVISAGFAGALAPDILRGHMLMPHSVANEAGEEFHFELTMPATPRLHTGRLLTVDRVLKTKAEKQAAATEHRAIACDMETFAVAKECSLAGTRFLSVRIISDGLDDELPPEVERLMNEKNFAKQAGIALQAILKRPGAALDLWKLRDEANKAADRLAKFLLQVIPQL